MTIAYDLYGQDNDSFIHCKDQEICSTCGCSISKSFNPNFKLKRKNFDISTTYDGYQIISSRLKSFLDNHNMSNIKYTPLENNKGFYYVEFLDILEIDVINSDIFFGDKCQNCSQYSEIIKGSELLLKNINKPIQKGIYRTDIEFGQCDSKSPLIIIGIKTYQEMVKEKFRGMDSQKLNYSLS